MAPKSSFASSQPQQQRQPQSQPSDFDSYSTPESDWRAAAAKHETAPRFVILSVVDPAIKANTKPKQFNHILARMGRQCDIGAAINFEQDSAEVKERIRLPNVILLVDRDEMAEPSAASFIRGMPFNKITLFDHSSAFYSANNSEAGGIREVTAREVRPGDEWRCSGRLMNRAANQFESSGLFNVNFFFKGRVTQAADQIRSEMVNLMDELTHHSEPNYPQESVSIEKYIQENQPNHDSAAGVGPDWATEQQLREKYSKLSDEEKAPYVLYYQSKLKEWEEANRMQNEEWLRKSLAISLDVAPVCVRISAADVTIRADYAQANPSEPRIPVISSGLKLITPQSAPGEDVFRHQLSGGPPYLLAHFQLDRVAESDQPPSSVEWSFQAVSLGCSGSRESPPPASKESFLLKTIRRGTTATGKDDDGKHTVSDSLISASSSITAASTDMNTNTRATRVSVPLTRCDINLSVEPFFRVEANLMFAISPRLSLNDWAELTGVEWHLYKQDILREMSGPPNSTVKANLSCNIPPPRSQPPQQAQPIQLRVPINLQKPNFLQDSIPLCVLAKGEEQFVAVFDFLLSKRIPVTGSTESAGLPWDAILHPQIGMRETLREYLPGLAIFGEYSISFHLGECGILTALIVEPSGDPTGTKAAGVSFLAGRSVILCYRPIDPFRNDLSLQLNSVHSNSLDFPPTATVNLNPISAGELLAAVNMNVQEWIPAVFLNQMLIESFAVRFEPREGPSMIVAGESGQKEFFYAERRLNETTKEWEILIKIHSELIDEENFSVLATGISEIGLNNAAVPQFYIWNSKLRSEDDIFQMNCHRIKTCMGAFRRKEWQEINQRLIKEIPIGAHFYTQVAMSEYIVTPIDLIQLNEQFQEMKAGADALDSPNPSNEGGIDSTKKTGFSWSDSLLTKAPVALIHYLCEFIDFNSIWYGLEFSSKQWYKSPLLNDEHWYKNQLASRFHLDLASPLYSAENLSQLRQYRALRKSKGVKTPVGGWGNYATEDEGKEDQITLSKDDPTLWRAAAESLQKRLNLFEYRVMQQRFPHTQEEKKSTKKNLKASTKSAASRSRPGCSKPHYSIPTRLREFLLLTPPFTPALSILSTLKDSDYTGDPYIFYSSGVSKYPHSDLCWFAHRYDEEHSRWFALYTGSVFVYDTEQNQHLGVAVGAVKEQDFLYHDRVNRSLIGRAVRQLYFLDADSLPVVEFEPHNRSLWIGYKNIAELFENKRVNLFLTKILPIIDEKKGVFQYDYGIYQRVKFSQQEMAAIQADSENTRKAQAKDEDLPEDEEESASARLAGSEGSEENKQPGAQQRKEKDLAVAISSAESGTGKVSFCSPRMSRLLEQLQELIQGGEDDDD